MRVILLWICFFSLTFAQETLNKDHQMWEEATQIFQQAKQPKDFAKAAAIWQSIADKNGENFALCYNLGNAYLKSERVGYAILYYRKALLFKPRNTYARENLTTARSQRKFAMNQSEDSFAKYIFFWHNSLSKQEQIYLFLLSYSIFFLSFVGKFSHWQKISSLFVITLLTTMFIGSGLFDDYIRGYPFSEAVLIGEEISVHKGDGTNYQKVFQETELAGLEAKIIQTRGDWKELWFPNQTRGWVHKSKIKSLQR